MKLLDAGAMGIICPMINTRADAEMLVHYANYAPVGTRSFGPTRAVMAYGADYASKANDTVITMAMAAASRSPPAIPWAIPSSISRAFSIGSGTSITHLQGGLPTAGC